MRHYDEKKHKTNYVPCDSNIASTVSLRSGLSIENCLNCLMTSCGICATTVGNIGSISGLVNGTYNSNNDEPIDNI